MFEQMVFQNGKLLTPGPLKYRVLLAPDVPDGFEMIYQAQGNGPGPFGSKGAGEGSLLCVAAAIANAIDDAVGARVTALPLSPENVYAALLRRGHIDPPAPHLNGHLRLPEEPHRRVP
jgi:CO/xanthine dehydrogenase Mo-binding subunit